jgi:myo-inositol-1(or 4)-monophosphatase
MSVFLKFAKEVAFEVGKVLLAGSRKKHSIGMKGAIDLVTEMDLKSEKLIHSAIRRRFPSHSILAEEGHSIDTGSRYKWIVDPLDGTTNYAHGYPVWCVSIALEIDGEIDCGVIYNPNLDEMFFTERGKGAYRNRRRIYVSHATKLNCTLLVTGFPYDIRTTNENNLDNFAKFYKLCQGVRRSGSAALDLAYTAAGIFDGYWEMKLSPWDCAAGKLLVEEAGGKVTDFAGRPFSVYGKQIVAANSRILKQMIRVLRS